MMNKVELQIYIDDEYKSLDIDVTTSFPFNIQVNDVINPTATKIPFSSQISLPRTKYNNDIFENIWKFDTILNRFDPLVRTQFRLYINYDLFQEGYLRLEQITKTEYKIRLYGGLGDYFLELEEIKLKDLNYGNELNHRINANFLQQCWTTNSGIIDPTTQEEIFNYAMCYQGQYDNFDEKTTFIRGDDNFQESTWQYNSKVYSSPDLNENFRTTDFNGTNQFGEYRSYYQKPMVRFKYMFNKCISYLGTKGWTTNLDNTFFNSNNPYWNNTWVIFPNYTTRDVTVVTNLTTSNTLGTGFMGDNVTNTTNTSNYVVDINNNNAVNITVKLPVYILATPPEGVGNEIIRKQATPDGFAASLRCNIIINGTVYQSIPITTGASQFTIAQDNTYRQQPINFPLGSSQPFIYKKRALDEDESASIRNNPNATESSNYQFEGVVDIPASTFPTGITSIRLQVIYNGSTYWETPTITGIKTYTYGAVLSLQQGEINIYSESANSIRSGSAITAEDIIQTSHTALEFVKSYCKTFGLYFIKNPYSKEVSIVTRSTFYGDRIIEDWTNKLDYNREILINPIPYDFRYGTFKWKEEGTKYEEDYFSRTSRQYGSFRFDTGNEHSNEEKNMLEDNIFSNCIIATDTSKYFLGRSTTLYSDNKSLPHFQDNSDTKVNIPLTLVFRNGNTTTSNNAQFQITDDNTQMASNGYCWLNGFNNLTNSYPAIFRSMLRGDEGYSLNFGTPEITYNYLESVVNDATNTAGIYPKYWQSYLQDRFSRDCRILTAYFTLSNSDISSNLLSKFIIVNNTLYTIEKVYNFDPTKHRPTKVDLIRVMDINNYTDATNSSRQGAFSINLTRSEPNLINGYVELVSDNRDTYRSNTRYWSLGTTNYTFYNLPLGTYTASFSFTTSPSSITRTVNMVGQTVTANFTAN